MKNRTKKWLKIKHSGFSKLIFFYDVYKSLSPKEKRYLKKGLKK